MEHQAGKGDKMQAGNGFGQAFVVPGQSPETSTARPAQQLLKDVTRGSESVRDSATPK